MDFNLNDMLGGPDETLGSKAGPWYLKIKYCGG